MSSTLDWTPPGPGPWQQDSAHNPVAQTATVAARPTRPGSTAGSRRRSAPTACCSTASRWRASTGSPTTSRSPSTCPVRTGPKDPEWIGAEFGRRAGVAAQAFEERIWRDAMRRWDDELKPASIARHRELDVDLAALDDGQLQAHIDACIGHVSEMVYQHHRHNAHALVPVGDFLLHAAGWTGRPPATLLSVFDGYSPVSSVVAPEMRPALEVLRKDDEARALLFSDGDPAEVLDRLRARVPEVGEYIDAVHFRLLEGFDITEPHHRRAAGSVSSAACRPRSTSTSTTALRRSDAAAAELRAAVPEEHRAAFDDLLAEGPARVPPARRARPLQRDLGDRAPPARAARARPPPPAARPGAAGRRRARGRASDELDALFAGADAPTAEELHQRAARPRRAHPRRRAPLPRFASAAPATGRHAPAAARPA